MENQKKLQKRAGLWFLQHACTIVNHSPKDGSGWIPHSDQKQSPEPSLCISRQGSCSFSEHACTKCAHHKNDQKSSFFWLKIKRTSPPPPWSTHIPIYISLSLLSLSLSLSLSPPPSPPCGPTGPPEWTGICFLGGLGDLGPKGSWVPLKAAIDVFFDVGPLGPRMPWNSLRAAIDFWGHVGHSSPTPI